MLPRSLPIAVSAELRRVVALIALLAVFTGTLLAGHRYFYCAPMARIAVTECCGEGPAPSVPREEMSFQAPARRCCDARAFDAGDEGVAPSAPDAPPLLLAACAVVAELDLSAGLSRAADPRRTSFGPAALPRAGPLRWRTSVDVSLS